MRFLRKRAFRRGHDEGRGFCDFAQNDGKRWNDVNAGFLQKMKANNNATD
jgi:hypothetical protein